MKTFNIITKKLTLIIGMVMGTLILASILAHADPIKKVAKDTTAVNDEAALMVEILEQWEEEENLLAEFKALNPPTVKIFDANDELIYEAVVEDIETTEDKKLLLLINQSDFLMSYANTSYYKLFNDQTSQKPAM